MKQQETTVAVGSKPSSRAHLTERALFITQRLPPLLLLLLSTSFRLNRHCQIMTLTRATSFKNADSVIECRDLLHNRGSGKKKSHEARPVEPSWKGRKNRGFNLFSSAASHRKDLWATCGLLSMFTCGAAKWTGELASSSWFT